MRRHRRRGQEPCLRPILDRLIAGEREREAPIDQKTWKSSLSSAAVVVFRTVRTSPLAAVITPLVATCRLAAFSDRLPAYGMGYAAVSSKRAHPFFPQERRPSFARAGVPLIALFAQQSG